MIRHEFNTRTAFLYGLRKDRHVVLQQTRDHVTSNPREDGGGFMHEIELSGSDLIKLSLLYLSRGSYRLRRMVSRLLFDD